MPDINSAARAQKASKPLLTIADNVLSYGDQWSRCHSLQAWFIQQSAVGEMPVLLAVSNEMEQASLLLALIVMGYPPLILDPAATSSEAAVILAQSQFGSIISDEGLQTAWQLDKYRVPRLKVSLNNPIKGIFGQLLGKRKTKPDNKSWPACVVFNSTPIESVTGSLAYIVFTSGTTAKPKGVEITHEALAAQMNVLMKQYDLGNDCRLLNTLPLHHVDGLLQGPLLAWCSGGILFRPLPFSTQNLRSYMDSIYRNQVTHLIAVPTILALMARLGQDWKDNFASEDFKFIVSCAGHLECHLWETIETIFEVNVINMYGLSEMGTSAIFNGPDDQTRRVGCLGKPVNSHIRIVNDNGQCVDIGEAGELLIASNQLMRGYHNDVDATNAVMDNGWLLTGDLVRQLDTGHIAYVGRKKQQIISGGRNISPEEISTCINQHIAVLESVVFGQYDPDWGEKVVAMIVVDSAIFDETQLTQWCRHYLSEYKVPKQILVVGHLEKGPSGKIRINTARQIFSEWLKVSSVQTLQEGDVKEKVLAIATRLFRSHRDEITIDATIDNTPGWDSLTHMSLIVTTETAFSITFSPREIMQIDSLRQIINLCQKK